MAKYFRLAAAWPRGSSVFLARNREPQNVAMGCAPRDAAGLLNETGRSALASVRLHTSITTPPERWQNWWALRLRLRPMHVPGLELYEYHK